MFKKMLIYLMIYHTVCYIPCTHQKKRSNAKKMSTKKRSMDLYLAEVFKQFIALKDDDFKKSQEVFKSVFEQVKQKMGDQCNYFKKYSSQIMYAGSVYDGIKVSKLDEFDMDIVIRLPISYNDITIENETPGFVKMKIVAFDNLDKQKEWENCHKVTRDWRDSDKYFLQNKFRHWLHGIVQKALNEMGGRVDVNGVTYLLMFKMSGPAYTLNIKNDVTDEHFLLDVDLVPVIRFMPPRWPDGYRKMESENNREWLVVPKANKALNSTVMKNRCWRLSFQEYEREMMKDCQSLKTTIRLVKKMRDALGMKSIASYYIKTLFLWKVHQNEKSYWQKKHSEMFYEMVNEFYQALLNKNIPYFWNDSNNLIEAVKPTVLKLYSDKLKEVLSALHSNDVEKVVSYLLTEEELKEFRASEFYQKQPVLLVNEPPVVSRAESKVETNPVDKMKLLKDEINSLRSEFPSDAKIKDLERRVEDLEDIVRNQEDRLRRLEMQAFDGLKAGEVGTCHNNIMDLVLNDLRHETTPLVDITT